MVSVRIPTPLRKLSGDRDELDIEASTVSVLIEELESECPGIKNRLCDESGNVRRFINLYVNNEDIRFLEGMDTKLNDGDVVSIIPAIAGGGGNFPKIPCPGSGPIASELRAHLMYTPRSRF